MIICLPTTENRGLESVLSTHFGRAPWYTIINTETGAIDAIQNDTSTHVHGACSPTEEIRRHHVEGVLCRGIGGGASARLAAAGIAVFLTEEKDAAAGVMALREGKARLLGNEGACSDGDHHHGRC